MVAQVCLALMFTSCLGMLLGAAESVACACSHHVPLWEAVRALEREFALHCQAVGVRLLDTSLRQVLYPCKDEGHRSVAFPDGEPAPGLWHGVPLAPFFGLF